MPKEYGDYHSIGLIKTRENILRTPKDAEPAITEDCL